MKLSDSLSICPLVSAWGDQKTHFSLSFKSQKIVFYYVLTKVAGFFFQGTG